MKKLALLLAVILVLASGHARAACPLAGSFGCQSVSQSGRFPAAHRLFPVQTLLKFTGAASLAAAGTTQPLPLAQMLVGGVTPMNFGCTGDGVTNDAACLQAALTAMAGKALYLGGRIYCTNRALTAAGPVILIGSGNGYPNNKTSGLRACAANLDLLSLPSASHIAGVYIDMGEASGWNTSGAAITTGASSFSTIIEQSWIDSPCIGIALNGNTITVDHDTISYFNTTVGTGCGGITVGYSTTAAGTVDPRITNTTIAANQSNPQDFDMSVHDAGGLFLENNDLLYGKIGTVIDPGVNQVVQGLMAINTVLGDTTVNQSLSVSTSDRSAVVKILRFTGTWAGPTSADSNVTLANTGAGLVTDIYFDGHASVDSTGDGILIASGVGNVSIDATHICAYTTNAVELAGGASTVRIRNSDLKDVCAQSSLGGTVGIALDGSNAQITLTGNDLTGNATPISGMPTGGSIIANNNGVDQLSPTIASASTVTLGTVAPTWLVAGTTGIATIFGGWNNRAVRLIATGGAISFRTGGNICNALTSMQNVPVDAVYNSTSACWYLK